MGNVPGIQETTGSSHLRTILYGGFERNFGRYFNEGEGSPVFYGMLANVQPLVKADRADMGRVSAPDKSKCPFAQDSQGSTPHPHPLRLFVMMSLNIQNLKDLDQPKVES